MDTMRFLHELLSSKKLQLLIDRKVCFTSKGTELNELFCSIVGVSADRLNRKLTLMLSSPRFNQYRELKMIDCTFDEIKSGLNKWFAVVDENLYLVGSLEII
ncbi:MAG: hypothetical protein COU51_00385 [Parcubacteria group bacterium CG10_big_fil_rev_8_21_14_0_10_36_14]|nr:MAG: hypothetical protein COU51_00385 [Parcubacteria group bacterium CG10_big_fil_rev_8_21_14_0_10_36_14]